MCVQQMNMWYYNSLGPKLSSGSGAIYARLPNTQPNPSMAIKATVFKRLFSTLLHY